MNDAIPSQHPAGWDDKYGMHLHGPSLASHHAPSSHRPPNGVSTRPESSLASQSMTISATKRNSKSYLWDVAKSARALTDKYEEKGELHNFLGSIACTIFFTLFTVLSILADQQSKATCSPELGVNCGFGGNLTDANVTLTMEDESSFVFGTGRLAPSTLSSSSTAVVGTTLAPGVEVHNLSQKKTYHDYVFF